MAYEEKLPRPLPAESRSSVGTHDARLVFVVPAALAFGGLERVRVESQEMCFGFYATSTHRLHSSSFFWLIFRTL